MSLQRAPLVRQPLDCIEDPAARAAGVHIRHVLRALRARAPQADAMAQVLDPKGNSLR
jgi:hypothetical protein